MSKNSLKIVINPEFKVLSDLIHSIATNGVPDSATCVYQGRNNIYRLSIGGDTLSIKAFRSPGAINRYVYTNIRLSKARRSYETAFRLNEMGINSPTPVAYIEEKAGMALRRSYYICRHIEATDMRYVENRPDKGMQLRALAAEMLKVHRAGVRLHDFSPGNILFTREKNDTLTFYHIDINRISFNVTSRKLLYKMFGTILVEFDDIRTLAGEYARLANLPVDETITAAIDARKAFLKKMANKKQLKKILKLCHK